ncbi:hypothetical protein B0H17DRAFT_605657 [Mycena rosella]|uniref:Uncharacterized protein n=1 Tax=Mycena rosella TaxID=1033263 RepID=A0AAD7M8R6_MYCRO|nr:hypothetical protein B0H17DRAFT_605657 [Mycena rosella]
MGGQTYDPGYITRESVAQSFAFDPMASHDNPVVYSAFPGDGRASNQGYSSRSRKFRTSMRCTSPLTFFSPLIFRPSSCTPAFSSCLSTVSTSACTIIITVFLLSCIFS